MLQSSFFSSSRSSVTRPAKLKCQWFTPWLHHNMVRSHLRTYAVRPEPRLRRTSSLSLTYSCPPLMERIVAKGVLGGDSARGTSPLKLSPSPLSIPHERRLLRASESARCLLRAREPTRCLLRAHEPARRLIHHAGGRRLLVLVLVRHLLVPPATIPHTSACSDAGHHRPAS